AMPAGHNILALEPRCTKDLIRLVHVLNGFILVESVSAHNLRQPPPNRYRTRPFSFSSRPYDGTPNLCGLGDLLDRSAPVGSGRRTDERVGRAFRKTGPASAGRQVLEVPRSRKAKGKLAARFGRGLSQ